MSNITIQGNNVYDSDGDYIGSVCYKPQGHWTAYLATDAGDEVVGQYSTKESAAEAVDKANGERSVDEILDAFDGEKPYYTPETAGSYLGIGL